jgi:NADH-quinone oxidoreductase subunit J
VLGTQIAFYFLAVGAVASAIGVVAFRNAVYNALSLIVTLFCLALFFLQLDALFIATVQVLIYAGAIMVLFLFVVTMLAPEQRDTGATNRLRWQTAPAVALGIILAGGASYLLYNVNLSPSAHAGAANNVLTETGKIGNTQAFGMALFHGFLFPFEVTSAILVVAIIGAVVLGRRAEVGEPAPPQLRQQALPATPPPSQDDRAMPGPLVPPPNVGTTPETATSARNVSYPGAGRDGA